jgi:hypothetical protein
VTLMYGSCSPVTLSVALWSRAGGTGAHAMTEDAHAHAAVTDYLTQAAYLGTFTGEGGGGNTLAMYPPRSSRALASYVSSPNQKVPSSAHLHENQRRACTHPTPATSNVGTPTRTRLRRAFAGSVSDGTAEHAARHASTRLVEAGRAVSIRASAGYVDIVWSQHSGRCGWRGMLAKWPPILPLLHHPPVCQLIELKCDARHPLVIRTTRAMHRGLLLRFICRGRRPLETAMPLTDHICSALSALHILHPVAPQKASDDIGWRVVK